VAGLAECLHRGRKRRPHGWRLGLRPEGGGARITLPGPHPAVRALLAAGWRVEEFDLFMATEPGLLDPRQAVPSPALA
jgi:hypothetical protein